MDVKCLRSSFRETVFEPVVWRELNKKFFGEKSNAFTIKTIFIGRTSVNLTGPGLEDPPQIDDYCTFVTDNTDSALSYGTRAVFFFFAFRTSVKKLGLFSCVPRASGKKKKNRN